jgi:hypothetical protein
VPLAKTIIADHRASLRTCHKNTRARGVFLTATITPPPAAVARNDPQRRMNDYLDALKFYLTLPTNIVDRVLFVDNSGSDIKCIERFVRSRVTDKVVEVISFDGNDRAVSYGKAYGEFKLLDFGLEHSELLGEEDIFWKVTGRLKFTNLREMIAAVPAEYDLLCDLHNVPVVGTGKCFGNRWMDLRVFSCSVKSYRGLFAGKYERLGPRMNQEILYDVVMAAKSHMDILPRFPIQPLIEGVSGRYNRAYHSGLQRIKTAIRCGLRKFAPFIWV